MEFNNLDLDLIMNEIKEPENMGELFSILFPKDNSAIDKFYEKENILNILSYVREKISTLNSQEKDFPNIIKRVLFLYNQSGEYKLSVEFGNNVDVPNVLKKAIEREDTGFLISYNELFLNYLVAKYNIKEFLEEDFRLFAELIVVLRKDVWIEPQEEQTTYLEMYIKCIELPYISEVTKYELILELPTFYLEGTSIMHFDIDEVYIEKIKGNLFEYFQSEEYFNLPNTLKASLQLTYEIIDGDFNENTTVLDLPLQIISSLNKKLVISYESAVGSLVKSSIELLIDCMPENAPQNNYAIEQYLRILSEGKKVIYKGNLLKEVHFNSRKVISVLNYIFENGNYQDFYAIYKIWLADNIKELVREKIGFKTAYVFQHMKQNTEAKDLYNLLISEGEKYPAIYNNLAVIHINNQEYEKAISLLEEGKQLDENDEHVLKNLSKAIEGLKEIKNKPKKMKDRYFKNTEKLDKSIIFAIYKLEEETPITINKLSKITKVTNEYYCEKILNKLIKLELISKDNEKGFVLDETIYKLAKEYIDPKLERQIIRESPNKLFRPIFYHESEINLYRVLIELFPQHLVFPNMDLKTIIEVDKIRDYIDADLMDYLFKAHVDFAIIDTTTYFPIIAFEKDSDYQDREPQKTNAFKKNRIFQTSGLPLIRLRYSSAMDYERLKEEIKQTTKSFLLEVKAEDMDNEILKHFDLKRLGIFLEIPSIDDMRAVWRKVVGEVIDDKTESISFDMEQAVLTINVSNEVEPILKLSQEIIKQEMYKEIGVLNQLRISYVTKKEGHE